MLAKLKKICIWILAAAVAVLFLVFALANSQTVALEFAPFPFLIEIRLFVFMGVLVLFGVFLGWFVASFECRRRYLMSKQAKQRMTALENEIAALRAPQHTSSSDQTELSVLRPSTDDL